MVERVPARSGGEQGPVILSRHADGAGYSGRGGIPDRASCRGCILDLLARCSDTIGSNCHNPRKPLIVVWRLGNFDVVCKGGLHRQLLATLHNADDGTQRLAVEFEAARASRRVTKACRIAGTASQTMRPRR